MNKEEEEEGEEEEKKYKQKINKQTNKQKKPAGSWNERLSLSEYLNI